LAALSVATGPVDRTSSLNWMMPLTVGSCFGSALASRRREGAALSVAFGTAYAASTWDSIVGGSGRSATAIANTVSYPAFFLIADYGVRQVRRLANELDEARHTAVEQGALAAAETARNREHRLLHDSAVQTLEAIAAGYELDPEHVRHQARKEAAALRRAIAGEAPKSSGLIAGLDALAAEFFERGLRVELVVSEIDEEPDPPVADALCHACKEALTNIVKHAGVSSTVVRAAPIDGGIRVTIRDQGVGFDSSLESKGFGLKNSIGRRLEEIGGRAEVTSTPGRGTKVELWGPM
jgi:signal transduction histidine kinase